MMHTIHLPTNSISVKYYQIITIKIDYFFYQQTLYRKNIIKLVKLKLAILSPRNVSVKYYKIIIIKIDNLFTKKLYISKLSNYYKIEYFLQLFWCLYSNSPIVHDLKID